MSDDKKATFKQQMLAARQKLLATVEGLTGEDWNIPVQAEGDQWTVLQMLRHLQDAHKGLTGQVQRLLAGGETVPRDFDVNRWNARVQAKTAEANMPPEEALANLQASLDHLMTVIDNLKDEDWERKGWQPAFQQELPLERLLYIIGAHEAQHTAEIASAVDNAKTGA